MVRKASRGVQGDCVLDVRCHSRRKAACWKEPGEPSCPQRLPTTWLCPQGHIFALGDLGASLWGCTAGGLLPTGADLGRSGPVGSWAELLGTGLSWGGSTRGRTYEQVGMGRQGETEAGGVLGLDDPSELSHMETGALWALSRARTPLGCGRQGSSLRTQGRALSVI